MSFVWASSQLWFSVLVCSFDTDVPRVVPESLLAILWAMKYTVPFLAVLQMRVIVCFYVNMSESFRSMCELEVPNVVLESSPILWPLGALLLVSYIFSYTTESLWYRVNFWSTVYCSVYLILSLLRNLNCREYMISKFLAWIWSHCPSCELWSTKIPIHCFLMERNHNVRGYLVQ